MSAGLLFDLSLIAGFIVSLLAVMFIASKWTGTDD